MQIDEIVEAAEAAHKQHWQATSDESTGDRQASAVTKAWQNAVASKDVRTEVPIADGLNERIDVVDLSTATAYEMKVSGKNPHHEFYKDIFKVIVYNQHHDEKLGRVVFITEKDGADRLNKGLGKAVQAVIESGAQYDFEVAVIGI
jgi:hypothetical protein